MKYLFQVGLLFGSLNFVQATSITLFPPNSTFNGNNAYENLVTLGPNQNIISASLVFDITLTAAGVNTFSYDIINRNDATATPVDNDAGTDYFLVTSPYSATAVRLGIKTFTLGERWQSTYNFATAGTLGTLNNYAGDGHFDFGFDPDCTYRGSIVFNYQAPDRSATVVLIGLSFVGLLAFRRQLRVN